MAQNAQLAGLSILKDDTALSPGGGGQPIWGLNDNGVTSSDGPLFSTDPWDTFWLGTRQLPGECDVTPMGVAAIELNVKKGKGSNVTRITYAGYLPKQFTVTCEICTPAQWAELQDIIDVYWTTPNKGSSISQIAVSVFHPNLAWLKIYSAVLQQITPLVRGKSGDGFKMTTLTFQENPPAANPKKNVTKSAGDPAQDPNLPNSSQVGASGKEINFSPPPPSANPANASVLGAPPTMSE